MINVVGLAFVILAIMLFQNELEWRKLCGTDWFGFGFSSFVIMLGLFFAGAGRFW